MYCIKCGVELADSEKKCPLCGTVVFHPDFPMPNGEKPYPPYEKPMENVSPKGVLFVLTMLFLLPFALVPLCDWTINGAITWSGYVSGAVVMAYVFVVLPLWFEKPNPVIFVPVDFACLALYLLYIDLITHGGWFLSFALPVVGGLGLLITAVVTLTRYVGKGYLYIFGGAFIALGGFMVLVEFLLNFTFHVNNKFFWSFYPLTVCFILGIMLIVIAICRPLQESLHKKFFL